MNETKLVKRFQNSDFTIHNSPHYIIALPASASSFCGFCVGRMIALSKGMPYGRTYPSWFHIGLTDDCELRPEIGAEPVFSRGGVYKGHIEPLGKNLAVLNMYPFSRYILWFRDPKDQITAFFCRGLQNIDACKFTCIFPFDGHRLSGDHISKSLNYLIEDGYLMHVLLFMGKWLHYRDETKSIVLTYERFKNAPILCLRNVAELLELNASDETIDDIHNEFATKTKKRNVDQNAYPKGWTGKIGVWQDYFCDENYANYKKVCTNFLQSFPWAKRVTEIYPLVEF
ncbi:sulfotransferase domain-containing protein [Acidobacteria bacterium AH-259-D05]|nr:sulfotransferase domain-containing protein [Acidobacteria bacterium AH-259-D05]